MIADSTGENTYCLRVFVNRVGIIVIDAEGRGCWSQQVSERKHKVDVGSDTDAKTRLACYFGIRL